MRDVVSTCVSVADPVYAGQGSASLPLVFRCHQQKQSRPQKQPWKEVGSHDGTGFFLFELFPSVRQESVSDCYKSSFEKTCQWMA